MTRLKRIILSSTATLIAMNGAKAADLPVKAKAVEYVRICSLYGAGFFYIPGSDTCIKFGGFVRISASVNGGVYDQPSWNGDLGSGDRYRDNFTERSRFLLSVDTRTATEYGVVRAYAEEVFQLSTLGGTTYNPNSLATNLGNNTNLLDQVSGGYTTPAFMFIQFAGFTFGRSASAYATPWHGFPGNNSVYLVGGHDSVTGLNNVQYSAQFGNGISGTVGLDDPVVYNRTAVYNLSLPLNATGTSGNAYAGLGMPDVVGNIRVDQAWGLFQVSGALHQVDASYNTLGAGAVPTSLSQLSGHPETKYGGSAMVGLSLKNVPTGPGDTINFDTSWSKGTTKNVIGVAAAAPSFAMFGGVPGELGPAGSIGFGATTDGVYLPTANGGDGSIHLTTANGLRGALNHNWDPNWSSSLFGGAAWVRYDTTARTEYCAAYYLGNPGAAGTSTCNPNYSISMLGVVTRWTPVKNLTFSAETVWTHLNQSFTGTGVLAASAPLPTQSYAFKNQDTVSMEVRAQRNF